MTTAIARVVADAVNQHVGHTADGEPRGIEGHHVKPAAACEQQASGRQVAGKAGVRQDHAALARLE